MKNKSGQLKQPTPETDAVWADTSKNILEHARRLERERDEAREQLVRSNHFLHQAEENLESIYRERDEAREDAHQLTQKRNELLAYLDAAHYATCNAELRRERDEARREVDRYREEKDLSPMSWDT